MTTTQRNEARFAFFGTSEIAVLVLRELEHAGFLPALIVTAPDRAEGRGLKLTPSPVAEWATDRGIPTKKPETIDDAFLYELRATHYELFIVADYGKILPKALLDIPPQGVLNMHPSLLPRLRGPSPMRSAILEDEEEVGVSIILLDEKMDHGPLIAQRVVPLREWPLGARELETILPQEGGKLLAEILPPWIAGTLQPREQDHAKATFTRRFKKEDGLLDLSGDARANLLKIKALEGWPGTFAFFERPGRASASKSIRVAILNAHLEGGKLIIDTVKPEGKGAMAYADFLRSGALPKS